MRSPIKRLSHSLLPLLLRGTLAVASLSFTSAACFSEFLLARAFGRMPGNDLLVSVQASVDDLALAALIAPWERRFRVALPSYLFDIAMHGIAPQAAPSTLLALQLAVRSDPLDGRLYAMAAAVHWRLGNCADGDDAFDKFKQWGKPSPKVLETSLRVRSVACQAKRKGESP